MTDEPLYYAKGNEVWKRPIETPREGGGKTISIGFKVCTCTDVVGLKGAETVAKMLSLAEGHPDAYRHGWEDREADLIDGAKRVLSAPSSPGDGWEPIETAPRDGRHIQAAIIGTSFGFNAGRALPEVQTVVHWFSDPDGPGFYTSVNEQEPQRPFKATHWKHLTYVAAPSPGGDHEA